MDCNSAENLARLLLYICLVIVTMCLCLLLWAGFARAGCVTEPQIRAFIKSQVPDHRIIDIEPSLYLGELDKLPPQSVTPVPEKLLVFTSPSLGAVLVMGFDGGCVSGKTSLPNAAHQHIMRKIGAES